MELQLFETRAHSRVQGIVARRPGHDNRERPQPPATGRAVRSASGTHETLMSPVTKVWHAIR